LTLLLLIKLAPHLFWRWAEIVGQILSNLPTCQQLLILTPRLVVLVTIIVRRLQRKIALLCLRLCDSTWASISLGRVDVFDPAWRGHLDNSVLTNHKLETANTLVLSLCSTSQA
jgi:hypothetical protein